MQPANRVAKNTLILYMRMFITVFISLYSTRLILSALGKSDFGLFGVVGGAIAMLAFFNAAMSAATQRFMSYAQGAGDYDRQKNIFNVSVILHIIIACMMFLVLQVAGYFLFNGILNIEPDRVYMAKVIFQFLIVSTLFTVLSVPYDAVINAHEDMSFVAVLGIFEAVMKLLIALFVTYTSFDKLGAYGLFMALLTIVLLIIRRFYCYKKYEEARVNIRAYYDKSLFREMTSFGGWSLLGSASGLIANYGQGIVINMFFGTAVNAAQSVANQVSGQVGAFSSTMLKALNPVIAKSEGAGQRKVMIQASITGSKFSFYLFALFSIPIIIEMPLILNYWLEDVPDYAMVFCRLLLIINLIDQMFITLPTSIASTGKIKNYQKTVSLLALTPLILTYFLFYWSYPPETLYLVFIGHRLVRAFGPVLYFSKKVFGLSVKYYLKEVVLRCIAITLLAVIPSYLLHKAIHIDGLRLILVGLLSGVLFILSVWWIGLSKVEKQYIVKMIKALLSKLPIKFT